EMFNSRLENCKNLKCLRINYKYLDNDIDYFVLQAPRGFVLPLVDSIKEDSFCSIKMSKLGEEKFQMYCNTLSSKILCLDIGELNDLNSKNFDMLCTSL